jgi:hypothetical protein
MLLDRQDQYLLLVLELNPFYTISTPLIWKFTVVAEADPETVFGVEFAGITCFKSTNVVVFAATDTPESTATESILIVAVADDAAVFVIAIFVTTVVVDEFGTV